MEIVLLTSKWPLMVTVSSNVALPTTVRSPAHAASPPAVRSPSITRLLWAVSSLSPVRSSWTSLFSPNEIALASLLIQRPVIAGTTAETALAVVTTSAAEATARHERNMATESVELAFGACGNFKAK